MQGSWPYTMLSFSASPTLQPFFPNGFHKQPLKIGAFGKTSQPNVSKRYPLSTSQWPVPQSWFPALLRKSGPQQSWSGVTPLPVGYRTDEQLSRENRIGKGIHTYTCWKWHSAAAPGFTAPGEQVSMGVMHSCCRGKGLILVSAFLMGSYVLIHLVKPSHEHHFLQHLAFPLKFWHC